MGVGRRHLCLVCDTTSDLELQLEAAEEPLFHLAVLSIE